MKPLPMGILSLFLHLHLLAEGSSFQLPLPKGYTILVDTILKPVSIHLYPNPSSNWLFIKHPLVTKKDAQILITDIAGNVFQKIVFKTQSLQTIINISHLPAGIYLVTWANGVERATARLSKE